MTEDKQLQLFLKAFDLIKADLVVEVSNRVCDELEPRFLKLEGNLDWIVGSLDADEKERLALGFNFDRKHIQLERRVSKLELAAD